MVDYKHVTVDSCWESQLVALLLSFPSSSLSRRGPVNRNRLGSHRPAAQIFSDASKGGTVSLPESAYTAVIRACCRDGRADRARETLEALKRADLKPRVRWGG